MPMLAAVNELKPLNPPECEMIPLDKHKLEVEHPVKQMFIQIIRKKYFEDLLRHRDEEL